MSAKLAFLVALAKSDDPAVPLGILRDGVTSIRSGSDTFTVFIPDDYGDKLFRLFFARQKNIPSNTHSSIADDNSWDIWCVHTLNFSDGSRDDSWGTDIFRHLRFLRRSVINRSESTRIILGPWSSQAFERRVGWLSDSIVYPQIPDQVDGNGHPISYKRNPSALMAIPHIVVGDNAVFLAELYGGDYDPTAYEIDNNIEANIDEVFRTT
jgi:hypothetical protein